MRTVPEKFAEFLLAWYRKNARVLPWREDPSPYHVWVSEIMLQQTRVEAVRPYFARFLSALPDLESLASAEEETLLKLWEGLGYYNRVKNMQKAARLALEKYGGIPDTVPELLTLPGIGPYTAGAVASIAFGQPEPAVDGNVLRVMTRLLAYEADITSAAVRRELGEALRPQLAEDPSAFNQALMELGAVVCLPNGAPKCGQCPVASLCRAHQQGEELRYPPKKAKKERKIVQKTIFLFERDGKTAVYRRPEHGLLSGMWGFPEAEDWLEPEETGLWLEERGFDVSEIEPLGEAKHIFSHLEWHMTGYRVRLRGLSPKRKNTAEEENGAGDGKRKEAGQTARSGDSAETAETAEPESFGNMLFLPAEKILSSYALPSAYAAYTRRLHGADSSYKKETAAAKGGKKSNGR